MESSPQSLTATSEHVYSLVYNKYLKIACNQPGFPGQWLITRLIIPSLFVIIVKQYIIGFNCSYSHAIIKISAISANYSFVDLGYAQVIGNVSQRFMKVTSALKIFCIYYMIYMYIPKVIL